MNVPEIYDGTVEIKSVSREAGERSKIAVYTDNPNIDPIGSCVGPKGTRVRTVVTELNGEMIDIIAYDEDPILYISNALAPAKVTKVKINQKDNSALVIVPDDQLSLAIGKKGQNARLAVRLTGWKIDIKSVTEASEQGISYDNDESFNEELLEVFKPEEEINEEAFIVEESKQESLSEERQPKKAKKAPIKHETAESEEAIKLKEELENTENQDDDYVKVFTADEEIEEETEPEYDPKYDEDIDYDEYDKYYE